MAKNSETGYAKNAANFESLISYSTGYGETYNPSKEALKLPALTAHLAASHAALQEVKEAKAEFDRTINERKIAFQPIKSLATKIVNALAATDASSQNIDDVKSINLKIQGKRAKNIKPPTPEELAAGLDPKKPSSASQQGFDNIIDHFARLITTLSGEPNYQPNESALQVATLTALLADLRAKNTAATNTTTAWSNARINRDQMFYADGTGMVDIALAAKAYIKSLFGATSPQFKQVSGLTFSRPKGD